MFGEQFDSSGRVGTSPQPHHPAPSGRNASITAALQPPPSGNLAPVAAEFDQETNVATKWRFLLSREPTISGPDREQWTATGTRHATGPGHGNTVRGRKQERETEE